MMFFERSKVSLEWTNQHGCGGDEGTNPNKLNCALIFQIGCQSDTTADLPKQLQLDLKNGRNTNTPDEANSNTDWDTQATTNDDNGRGRHENEGWYYQCKNMQRNKGLFLADQNVKGDTAIYTRQNPNGNRRGLECPEERDYYPYWNPSPFMDVAVLTDNLQDCKTRFNYEGESQNVKEVWGCFEKTPNQAGGEKCYEFVHNETLCNEDTDCEYRGFKHDIPAPRCEAAPWTRANSLGNGDDGRPTMFNWTFPSLDAQNIGKYTKIETLGTQKLAKCILRIRYNISTDDYDVANTNASHNKNLNAQPDPIVSPVTQNPTVDIGLNSLQGLRLAINTNQFGRTFQDRSHTWYLMSRGNADFENAEIQSAIVQGKRGNIVQTFPSVEYDFVPNADTFPVGQLIHMQWTGSNTHNNGNPAGDGQAGDAGEGRGGSDRSNLIQLMDKNSTFPAPYDKAVVTDFFAASDVYQTYTGAAVASGTALDSADLPNAQTLSGRDAQLYMVSGGFWNNEAEVNQNNNAEYQLNVLLNNAPASMRGMTVCPKTGSQGTYEFTCTRNNNFSNRDQKLTINVTP